MRVRRKFLQLTSQTVPFGTEKKKLRRFLPKGIKEDSFGNFYLTIGEDFTTMFTCHLDTASKYQKRVNHIHTGNIIGTDGSTILGADDKAGMVVLLYMIEKRVPGLYYFFIGEEVGCIGSSALSENFEWDSILKVISFDRRGTSSVITEQLFGRCCSDEFANSLSNALNSTNLGMNFAPDNTGILTDSAQFVYIVPECTNISVGYYNEHTTKETQDIEFLSRLCRACVKIDWESLPIVRTPNIPVNGIESFESFLEFDEDFYTFIVDDGKFKKMFISNIRIEEEINLISDMLKDIGYINPEVIWNGRQCYCREFGGSNYIGSRQDLIGLIPDLEYISESHLSEEIGMNLEENYF